MPRERILSSEDQAKPLPPAVEAPEKPPEEDLALRRAHA